MLVCDWASLPTWFLKNILAALGLLHYHLNFKLFCQIVQRSLLGFFKNQNYVEDI